MSGPQANVRRRTVGAAQSGIDGLSDAELIRLFDEKMEPVKRWIWKGNGRTAEQRAWVFLYEINHLGGESIDDIAKRLGVTPQRIHTVVKEFRATFPLFRSGNRKSGTTRAKMSAAHRRHKKD